MLLQLIPNVLKQKPERPAIIRSHVRKTWKTPQIWFTTVVILDSLGKHKHVDPNQVFLKSKNNQTYHYLHYRKLIFLLSWENTS